MDVFLTKSIKSTALSLSNFYGLNLCLSVYTLSLVLSESRIALTTFHLNFEII